MLLKSSTAFSVSVMTVILISNDLGFEKFCYVSIKLLNKHAPIKKKYKRSNQMPFVTKTLSKAIMKRWKLRNNYLKNKTNANRMPYK